MAPILVIDDDSGIHYTFGRAFGREAHHVDYAFTATDGIAMATQTPYAVIFLDVKLPDGNGLAALPRLKNSPGSPEIVIITGYGDGDGAELAIRHGAWDYIEKSQSIQEIVLTLNRALKYHKSRHSTPDDRLLNLSRERIVGESPAIRRCLEHTAQYAATNANVLISGETGTGKEVFARTIHENSARKSHPFVVVDCASLPDKLAESILFGHVRGAFTGAETTQKGLVAEAAEGTLFLDEVGELTPALQKVFLRVLQERTIRPVGSTREIPVNFRLISATNRDIPTMVETGTFRSDLLFRLQTCTLSLPPLRERNEDIGPLTLSFIRRYCDFYQLPPKEADDAFMEAARTYPWPGNVRELASAMEYVVSAGRNETTLIAQHLPIALRANVARQRVNAPPAIETPLYSPKIETFPTLSAFRDEAVAQAEKRYLIALTQATGGNLTQAIERSGLSRSRFYAIMKKNGVTPQT